jgi:O-acetyl-ADP-ribose deacetylase (regulator of RNase III)
MQLSDYRSAIALDHPAPGGQGPALLGDLALVRDWLRPDGPPDRLRHLDLMVEIDARLTIRPPLPFPPPIGEALDRLLATRRGSRPTIQPGELPTLAQDMPQSRYTLRDHVSLWQGDITTLAADAIVNAANSAMQGCFIPFHACIDNAIHRIAGTAQRADCACIMQIEGGEVATGVSRITRGHHLPARFVLHTVGPIIADQPHPADRRDLAGCYTACLDLAAEVGGIRSVAFCAISTGVFRYPKAEAARIALSATADWLARNQGKLGRVIFNVFSDEDAATYRRELERAE